MSLCCIENIFHVRAPSSVVRQAVPNLSAPISHGLSKPVPIQDNIILLMFVLPFKTIQILCNNCAYSIILIQYFEASAIGIPAQHFCLHLKLFIKVHKSSSSVICFLQVLLSFVIIIVPSSSASSQNRSLLLLPIPALLEFEAGEMVDSADGHLDIARCLSKRNDDVEGGCAIRMAKRMSCESSCANDQCRITVH
jgi:hypothetical protein